MSRGDQALVEWPLIAVDPVKQWHLAAPTQTHDPWSARKLGLLGRLGRVLNNWRVFST